MPGSLRGLLAAVALKPLALHLAGAADSSGLFAGALFRGLFKVTAQLHLAIHALALQLLLERAKGLVDIVVANENLHKPLHLNADGESPPTAGITENGRNTKRAESERIGSHAAPAIK